MSYANETEVLEGVLSKFQKKRRKLQDNLKELNLQIDLYLGTSLMELVEGLQRKATLIDWQIDEIEIKIDLLEKKKNGGASLQPFLDK